MKGEGEEWREEKKGRGWVGGWVGALPPISILFFLCLHFLYLHFFPPEILNAIPLSFFCMAVPHAQARLKLAMQQR